MQKSTKLGFALTAIGAGSATATAEAAEHGATALTVAGGILTGACTALGVTSLILGWAGRRPEAEEV